MDNDLLVTRVRSEFAEAPGLRLTVAQAMRHWGLNRDECQRVINELIDTSFLRRNARGEILRTG
jgi:hypothetical protein